MTSIENSMNSISSNFGMLPSDYDTIKTLRDKNDDLIESVATLKFRSLPEGTLRYEKPGLQHLSDAAFQATDSLLTHDVPPTEHGKVAKKRRFEEGASHHDRRNVDQVSVSTTSEADKSVRSKASKKSKKDKGTYGRWTAAEHEMFVAALKIYGKKWKKVANMIKTRTAVQIRTHAQKYFIKMNKALNGDGVSEGGIPLDLDGRHGGASLSLQEQADLIKISSGVGNYEDDGDEDDIEDNDVNSNEDDDDTTAKCSSPLLGCARLSKDDDDAARSSDFVLPPMPPLSMYVSSGACNESEDSQKKNTDYLMKHGATATCAAAYKAVYSDGINNGLRSDQQFERNPLLLMGEAAATVEGGKHSIESVCDGQQSENLMEAAELLFSIATKGTRGNDSADKLDMDEKIYYGKGATASENSTSAGFSPGASTDLSSHASVAATVAAVSAMNAVVPDTFSWAAYYAMEAAARAASRHNLDSFSAAALRIPSHPLHASYPHYYPHFNRLQTEQTHGSYGDAFISKVPPQPRRVTTDESATSLSAKSDQAATTEADEDESGSSSDGKITPSAIVRGSKKRSKIDNKESSHVKEGTTKKYRYLTCSEKYGIIQRMKNCERMSGKQHGIQAEIAREYNVSQSTVYQILKKRDEIEFYCENELKNEASWNRSTHPDNSLLSHNDYWRIRMGAFPQTVAAAIDPNGAVPHRHNRIAEFETTLTQLLNRHKIDSIIEFKSFSEWYAAHLDIKDSNGHPWQCTQEWMDNFHRHCMDISFLK